MVAISASVRPASTAERAIGSERKRSIRPLLQILGDAERGTKPPKAIDWTRIPGHQEVGVVAVPGRLDRAAEDEGEQQHEHHRLDREGGQQVGLAADPAQAAPGEDDVSAGARRRRVIRHLVLAPGRSPSPSSTSSGGRPVSVMKTSSRVGRTDGDVVDRDSGGVEPPDRGRDRAAALAQPGRGRRRPRPTARRRRPRERASAASTRLGSSSVTSSRSPPTWSLSSSEVPSRDHDPVVDHRDPVGEPIGLVEVLGGQQHGGARGDAVLDRLPQARSGCGGRARWSARRGTAPAAGPPAPRRGRVGGACRPSRS